MFAEKIKNNLSWCFFLLAALCLYGFDLSVIENLENRFIDLRFNLRGPVAADERIVIAGIDQNTLTDLDKPFFAFAPVYAQVALLAKTAGARALLFDVVFPPSTEKVIKDHVREICDALGLKLPHKFYRQLGFEKPFRQALLQLKNSETHFVTGIAWEKNQAYTVDKAISRIAGVENTGYFNLPVDIDGKIRKALPYASADDGQRVNSVALLTAQAIDGFKLDAQISGYQQINFRGPRKTFRTIPLTELLAAEQKDPDLLRRLAGKLILLGFNDITDLKATPFGYMPGVEAHANIIDNLLNQRFLQPLGLVYELLLLAVIALIFVVLARKKRLTAIFFGVVALFVWFVAALSVDGSLLIRVVKPAMLLGLLIACEVAVYVRTIFKDRQRIRAIFGRYVNDAVLHEILAAPDQDFISGRRRRLCILFADIRGFTTFSEKRQAAEVVAFLNAYFSKVTEIIIDHNGVVDKFLGDGLLAFFNAPVEQTDYVDQAVKAASAMIDFTNSAQFKEISAPANLRIGVALHCGDVVFGNIGSEKKAEFTVIGDAVNACSRLESLNKEYATSLLVSEDVVKQCQVAVEWKKLGKKQLRGKSQEIDIYTLA
jgi:adenylate cyclase